MIECVLGYCKLTIEPVNDEGASLILECDACITEIRQESFASICGAAIEGFQRHGSGSSRMSLEVKIMGDTLKVVQSKETTIKKIPFPIRTIRFKNNVLT